MSISHLPHTKFWSNFVKSEIGLYAQKTIPLGKVCMQITLMISDMSRANTKLPIDG